MKTIALTLRKFAPHDFEDYFRLVGNAQVMAMITERALPRDGAKTDYESRLSRNSIAEDYGYYKITDAASGAFIGLAKLEVEHANSGEAELGYILLPEYWGRGIGNRVAKQLVDCARTLPGLERLFAIIDPNNIPSRKILTKNGFGEIQKSTMARDTPENYLSDNPSNLTGELIQTLKQVISTQEITIRSQEATIHTLKQRIKSLEKTK